MLTMNRPSRASALIKVSLACAGLLAMTAAAAGLSEADIAAWVTTEDGTFVKDEAGNVVEVRLHATWITDSDLVKLAELPHLTKIDLSNTWITDLGIEHLKPLQHVKELNLYYCDYLTDAAVAHLKGWKNLEHLNLRGTDISGRVFEHIARLTTLKSLDVGFSRVTDAGFEHLTSLAALEKLGFGGAKMSGAALPILKTLPSLRHLDVSGLQRTDSGLWGVALSDFNLDQIAALTQLEVLEVREAKITDRGLAALAAELVNLHTLDLGGTQVSGRGLQALTHLPKLQRLNLAGAKKVDDEAAVHLGALAASKCSILPRPQSATRRWRS